MITPIVLSLIQALNVGAPSAEAVETKCRPTYHPGKIVLNVTDKGEPSITGYAGVSTLIGNTYVKAKLSPECGTIDAIHCIGPAGVGVRNIGSANPSFDLETTIFGGPFVRGTITPREGKVDLSGDVSLVFNANPITIEPYAIISKNTEEKLGISGKVTGYAVLGTTPKGNTVYIPYGGIDTKGEYYFGGKISTGKIAVKAGANGSLDDGVEGAAITLELSL
ncbi:MAG: hypothetical protein ABH817_00460 [archaeon]